MDLNVYTSEMRKSVWDKAFFIDKIPGAKCVIDFGCADGAMIRMLGPLFQDMEFIGYDYNEDLIERACQALHRETPNISFFGEDNLHELIEYVKDTYKPEEICLNFSSVLHEVFSYREFGAIQQLIAALSPRFITIRDMYWQFDTDLRISYNELNNILSDANADPKCIKAFEEAGYSVCNWKGLIHFLMKYQWKDNGWEEELTENYFSWNMDKLHPRLGNNYTVIFNNFYQLPYLTLAWKDLFFHPELTTHAQFILLRNEQ